MKKGIFYIPCYPKETRLDKIVNEIKSSVVFCDNNDFKEAYFGEHLADKYEKITSSLNMISAISSITSKIKLSSLTTNLTFYNPSVLASHIALVDNMCKGRLKLGIGSGSNISDVESVNLINDDNRGKMIEILAIIKKLFKSKNLVNLNTKNFKVSTIKKGNKNLGLGFYNALYKSRDDLEIVIPALNPNSRNVKNAAINKWSIVISNFCSTDVVKNHVENYISNSPLNKKEALKKIKLARFIFVSNKKEFIKNLFKKNSPHMGVLKTIHTKLKHYNRIDCFGNDKNLELNLLAKKLFIFGSQKEVSEKIKDLRNKVGKVDTVIYTHVPMVKNNIFNNSLKLFSKCN